MVIADPATAVHMVAPPQPLEHTREQFPFDVQGGVVFR